MCSAGGGGSVDGAHSLPSQLLQLSQELRAAAEFFQPRQLERFQEVVTGFRLDDQEQS